MLKAILVSPQFLFITPAGEAGAGTGIVPLDDYQLASRLSYLLWATMPDDELMALADEGRLHQPAVLDAQVLRLLKDRRSRALFDGFGAQWLGVGGLKRQVFDPAMFPQMTAAMRQAMYDEVRLFFESIVRENKSVIRFVDGDYTYLNGTLAAVYGLEKTVKGPEMRKSPPERWQSRGSSGNAGRSRRNLFPQPHEPGEAWRVGAGTVARGACAVPPSRRSGPGPTGPDGHHNPYYASAYRVAPHESGLRELP